MHVSAHVGIGSISGIGGKGTRNLDMNQSEVSMSADSEPPTFLSLIVVSWNTQGLLRRCVLSALAALEHLPGEIIVVDNGSTDGTAEMVRREFGGNLQVELIANRENLGFAAGNNLGLRHSKGSVIGVVNPDIVIDGGTLQAMYGHALSTPGTGIVSCELVGTDGEPQTIHRAFPTLPRVLFTQTRLGRKADRLLLGRRFDDAYRLRSVPRRGIRQVDQVAGACFLMCREVIERIGGLFDERFPILGNDVDLCRRVHNAGLTVDLMFDQRMVHLGSASLRQVDEETRDRWRWEALTQYYAIHEPRWQQILLRWITPVHLRAKATAPD